MTLSLGEVAYLDVVARSAPPPGTATLVFGMVAQAVSETRTLLVGPFSTVVTIDMTVISELVPSGATPETTVLAYWDGTQWLAVPATITVTSSGGLRAVALVNHFTMFAMLHDPAGQVRRASATTPVAPTVPSGSWSGSVSSTGFSLVVWGGGAGTPVTSAILALQPRPVAMWALEPTTQRFRTYVPGAPAVVNDLVTLAAGQVAIVRTGTTATPAPAAPVGPTTTPNESSTTRSYVVTATDTLSAIGERFGVPWEQIAAANGIAGPAYVVRAGQVLTIPGTSPTPATSSIPSAPSSAAGARTHIVTATDTLSEIGALFDVPWQQIAAANGIAGPAYILRPGQVLTIPAR